MSNTTKSRTAASQTGFVSIMVTMLLIIIVSLIVLGFAQVSRRAQRQSLDRQLSTQAFYAAESGVNDASQTIFSALKSNQPLVDKTICKTPDKPTSPYRDLKSNLGNPADKVSYPCLLVSTTLKDIKLDLAGNGPSKLIPLTATSKIKTLHVSWTTSSNAGLTGCAARVSSGEFKANNLWTCPFGVLRYDLVPINMLDRASLVTNQSTAFLYPTQQTSATAAVSSTTKGAVAPMSCSGTTCKVDIAMPADGGSQYAMRASAIYGGGTIDVQGSDAGGSFVLFKGVQAQIDATGKAQDVLRRIQVRVSLLPTSPAQYSDQALVSGDSICKRFRVTANSFEVPGDIDTGIATGSNNPLCQPITAAPAPAPGDEGGDDKGSGKCDPASEDCATHKPPKLSWSRSFHITAAKPTAIGCIFDWGDGSTDTYPAANCNPGGGGISHDYPHDLSCQTYTVIVHLIFAGGRQYKINPDQLTSVPWGTNAPHC